MKKKTKDRGITLIVLIITIVVLLIITATLIIGINNSSNSISVENMKADIKMLEDKILVYYNQYAQAPIKGEERTDPLIGFIEEGTYYEIDLNKLDNLTLNYGYKNDGENDIYIVNTLNLRVYYLAGIDNSGERQHSFDRLGKATVRVEIQGEGQVEGATIEGTEYTLTSNITLNAIARTRDINETYVGYVFSGWYEEGMLVSENETFTFLVTKDTTYTAIFVPENFTLIYKTVDGVENITLDTNNTLTGYIGDTTITRVDIGNNVTSIGHSAFKGCTGLLNINLQNVVNVGTRAFDGCSNLKTIVAPKVQIINLVSFSSCTSLENVNLGSIDNPVTSIESSSLVSFSGCIQNNLTIKIYRENVTESLEWKSCGANNATIKYYNASTGVLEDIIWGLNYAGNTEINWTELPDSDKIIIIRDGAFKGCTSLALTSIPSKVTILGRSTFEMCTGLININLQNVTNIGIRTFEKCSNLKTIVASKVQNINQLSFSSCTSLENVELGSINNSIISIESSNSASFSGCIQNNLTIKIYVPNGTTSISGQPWGATNSTVEYYDFASGEKIN